MGYRFDYEPRRVDPYLKEGVYQQAWQLAADNRNALDLIVVYSWNEHGDHSAIEPTKGYDENTTAGGTTLLEKTRRYYRRLRAGCAPAATPSQVAPELTQK